MWGTIRKNLQEISRIKNEFFIYWTSQKLGTKAYGKCPHFKKSPHDLTSKAPKKTNQSKKKKNSKTMTRGKKQFPKQWQVIISYIQKLTKLAELFTSNSQSAVRIIVVIGSSSPYYTITMRQESSKQTISICNIKCSLVSYITVKRAQECLGFGRGGFICEWLHI